MIFKFDSRSRRDLLECIDSLRADAEAGKIIGFAAVGLGPDDATMGYTACAEKVTRLRIMGAIASLQYDFNKGEL